MLVLGLMLAAPAGASAQTAPAGTGDPAAPPGPVVDPASAGPQDSVAPPPVAPLPGVSSPIVGAPPPPPTLPPLPPPPLDDALLDPDAPPLVVDPTAPLPDFNPALAPLEGDVTDALLDPDSPLDLLSDLGVDWPDISAPLPDVPAPVVVAEVPPVLLPPELQEGVPDVVVDGRFALPPPVGADSDALVAAPALPRPGDAEATGDAQVADALSGGAGSAGATAARPFERDASDLLVVPGLTARQMAERDAAPLVAASALPAGIDPEQLRGYRVSVRGVDDIADDEFSLRFDELSELQGRDDKDANVAQLQLRAREDERLLTTLLRNKGYWGAGVTTQIGLVGSDGGAGGGRLDVALVAVPGPLYRYRSVSLPGLDATGADAPRFADIFGIAVGDPVDADVLIGSQTRLLSAFREDGFAFSELGEEQVTVDHDRIDGTLVQPVAPGGRYVFGSVEAPGDAVFGARHLARIARFRPGDVYRQSLVEDLRAAIIATGLVSQVDVTPTKPVDGSDRVAVNVAVTPAPPRTIAGEIGYSTGDGFRAEASWTHRNLFPPEGALIVRGIAGTREQLGAVTFRRNNFRGRDRVLTVQALASNQDRDAFKAVTAELLASYEQKTTILFQKPWVWSLGAEVIATSERPKAVPGQTPTPRREYYIAALPMSVGYDGSDDLLDPTEGFRLSARVSPEFSWAGAAATYARIQLDGSGYYPIGDKVVIAGRARVGTIPGAERTSIAPSRLFYAGGGGSVRGFSYQAVGPRDANNVPLGGKSLTELSLEARIRLPYFGGNFGVVPFIDAGHVSTTTVPRFGDYSVGAGVGLRYYSNFGPIRIDVGTPLTRRPGDPRVAVYVSLGQAF